MKNYCSLTTAADYHTACSPEDYLSHEQFEELLKNLDRAQRSANRAALYSQGLDDKLRFTKLEKEIRTARLQLRLMYYEFENAANITAE